MGDYKGQVNLGSSLADGSRLWEQEQLAEPSLCRWLAKLGEPHLQIQGSSTNLLIANIVKRFGGTAMLPIFFSLVAASLFGIGSLAIYGPEATAGFAWVDYVFWALILSGILVALAGGIFRCLLCRIEVLLHHRLSVALPCPCES